MKREKSPEPTKILITNLTKNVNKEHINEIFAYYGKLKHVDFPIDRQTNLNRGMAYVDYEDGAHAKKAIKYMNEGQIDGQAVEIRTVLQFRPRQPPPQNRRMGGPRYPPPPMPRRRMSPPRRRRSPPRRPRSPPRRRSPARRRRDRSRSSSTESR